MSSTAARAFVGVDDADQAERRPVEVAPVGARQALEVLGLPELARRSSPGIVTSASWTEPTAPVAGTRSFSSARIRRTRAGVLRRRFSAASRAIFPQWVPDGQMQPRSDEETPQAKVAADEPGGADRDRRCAGRGGVRLADLQPPRRKAPGDRQQLGADRCRAAPAPRSDSEPRRIGQGLRKSRAHDLRERQRGAQRRRRGPGPAQTRRCRSRLSAERWTACSSSPRPTRSSRRATTSPSFSASSRETEDQIAITRRVYNDTVETYNTAIQIFPAVIIARLFGFDAKDFFDAPAAAEQAPAVSLAPGNGA